MNDIKQGFKDYEQVGNTLDFLANIVMIYQIEKNLVDYKRFNPTDSANKKNLFLKLQDSLQESLKHLEAMGIYIMYEIEGAVLNPDRIEMNLQVTIGKKVLSEE